MRAIHMNRVCLGGALTRDPQLRKIGNGHSVADMAVAIQEDYTDRDGKEVKQTCFVDVVAWGRQAEACGAHLSKGSAVIVEGRLQYEQWEGEKGERHQRLRVRAARVHFVGGGNGGGGNGGNAGNAGSGGRSGTGASPARPERRESAPPDPLDDPLAL